MIQTYSTFRWLTTVKNPHFGGKLNVVHKEVYLNTSNVKQTVSQLFIISKEPRRTTYIRECITSVDLDGCEITEDYVDKSFTSFEVQKTKLRKKVLSVSSIVDRHPKKNTFFLTLTAANHNEDIRIFLNRYFTYLRKKQYTILNYFWVLEFGKNSNNPHYHVVVTFDSPINDFDSLKPDSHGWYGHTQIERVKKSVYRYMTKYLTKESVLCVNRRNCGFSQMTCAVFREPVKPTIKLKSRKWDYLPMNKQS